MTVPGAYFCGQCGEDWGEDLNSVCTRCGSVEKVDLLATKGRIVGEALATAVSPGDALTKTLMGTLGSFVGRRMTRGHPLISIGEVNLRPKGMRMPKAAKTPKPPKVPKKSRIRNELTKRNKPNDKP